MNKKVTSVIVLIAGMILLTAGDFIFTLKSQQLISDLSIGFGCALLVLGIGNLLRSFMVLKMEDKETKRLKAIEINDERNIRIREKTGYMISKIMNYLILIVVLALGFMNVDKLVIIIVAGLILVEFVLAIFFSNYYSKRM